MLPSPGDGILRQSKSHEADIRAALLLTYITLGWMTIEGAASIILGLLAKSLLLEAFGIDSAIELFSACVLLWRLRAEASGTGDDARIEAVEHRASRLAGYALYVLALYVIVSSVYGLITHNAADTRQSIWGIIVGVVAAVGMPVLAKYKLRLAAPNRLNSRALRADAMEAFTCGYLSWVLIGGLLMTCLTGWSWLDNLAALALVPFLVKEGREAIKGECGCGGACP